jgi:hypothetical protein
MSPCYKGHKSGNEKTQRDLKKQEQNQTPRIFLNGLEEEEEELRKYNPNRE